LFLDTRGQISEGTGSNVFLVVDGELLTPALTTGCLAGITRGLVIEWSGAKEVELPESALEAADEVFLASSTRDVQPVGAVDHRSYAAPGRITSEAAAMFARFSAENADP
jgi:branched-chain amino acid aminotransferase